MAWLINASTTASKASCERLSATWKRTSHPNSCNSLTCNFLRKRFFTRPSRDAAETVVFRAYGLHTRPGQEGLPERRFWNPCGYSLNSLNSELDTGEGGLQVVLPCLRPGEQVGGLPGQRRVADLPGDAQGLAAIRLSRAPLPGGKSNLTTQSMKSRDILHGASGPGLTEASLHLGQCLVRF